MLPRSPGPSASGPRKGSRPRRYRELARGREARPEGEASSAGARPGRARRKGSRHGPVSTEHPQTLPVPVPQALALPDARRADLPDARFPAPSSARGPRPSPRHHPPAGSPAGRWLCVLAPRARPDAGFRGGPGLRSSHVRAGFSRPTLRGRPSSDGAIFKAGLSSVCHGLVASPERVFGQPGIGRYARGREARPGASELGWIAHRPSSELWTSPACPKSRGGERIRRRNRP